MKRISIRTLGTGAADHFWDRIGESNVRGSCSTLIDGRILVDYGITGKENLARAGIDPGQIDYLFITHFHKDHCLPEKIAEMLTDRKGKAVTVVADPEVLKSIRKYTRDFVSVPAKPGSHFQFDGFEVTATPANHDIPKGIPLHYLFEFDGKTLYYALDGAWFTTRERRIIAEKKLDMIIWDATIGIEGDFRIFEHNDLRMLKMMYEVLASDGVVNKRTVILLDHMARTLWPELQSDCRKLIPRNWKIASDGAEFFL